MTQPVYTAFAEHALELADIFKMFVGSAPVAGTDVRPFMAALSTPHGPSTGAGTQSLQHITFARDGRTFVVGAVDPKEFKVEVRGFALVARQYQERFGEALPITTLEYDAFIKRVRAFCGSKQLVLVIRDVAAPSDAAVEAATEASRSGAWIAVLLVILVAGVIAAAVVLT